MQHGVEHIDLKQELPQELPKIREKFRLINIITNRVQAKSIKDEALVVVD